MRLRQFRGGFQALIDMVAWLVGVSLATWARFDFNSSSVNIRSVVLTSLCAGVSQVLFGIFARTYQGRHRYGSFEQVVVVCAGAGVATVLTAGLLWFRPSRGVPISAVFVAGSTSVLLMLAVRYLVRARRDHLRRPSMSAVPVLVLGAGSAGAQLVRDIQLGTNGDYRVVGIVDDDPSKRHLHVSGVRVLGGRRDLAKYVAATGAEMIIISVANPDAELHREVVEQATTTGLTVKTIPSLVELVNGRVTLNDVRDVDITDLLGRRPIMTDLTQIEGLLRGKRVLITGAGGSIGSELSRQVFRFMPAALGLLDRDESALHALQLSLFGRALLDDDSTILADIRDLSRMVEVMSSFKPDVVFHAAALKHLPMLERFPEEAVKTNIFGTVNVLQAATGAGVPTFVNISTDKAADPTSVLGYSKRITERLTAGAAGDRRGAWVSVRFGNVLGSRGSVIDSFTDQVRRGGPVTVTHPDVTRYFMTIPEAVQLVLQAAAIGRGGDALVLEMGDPVRIADVARQLIAYSHRNIEIVYTGLRHGEKLEEALFSVDETPCKTENDYVSRVCVPGLSYDDVDILSQVSQEGALALAMERLARAEEAVSVVTERPNLHAREP